MPDTPPAVLPAAAMIPTVETAVETAAPDDAEGDWLAAICPYLASADGTYRSATPDEGHRCTAQDPPATLPLAFQERYCLTDRHTRCEMYKFAREAGSAEGPAGPTVTAVGTTAVNTTAVGTRPLRAARASGPPDGIDRRTAAAAAGLGGVVVLVVVLVLLMGSCSSQPAGPGDGASPDPDATSVPAATASVTETPTPRATEDDETDPEVTPDPSAAADMVIRYEVQEGEALRAIADRFGITRNRLYRLNEGLQEIPPPQLPGEVILVPVRSTMTLEELEALPGYLGPADEA